MHTTDNTRKVNFSLDFYRLLFTLVICIHHAQYFIGELSWLKHGYIGVEFFLILSGYLLYVTFQKETQHSTLAYAKKRFIRLWPEYVVAAVLMILARGVYLNDFNLAKAVNELLMIQNTGLFRLGGYNYPCWYIPVMFLAGILIYSMLTVCPDWYRKLLAPLIIVLGYTYIGGLEGGLENWQYIGFLSVPLLRAMCGMSVGVLIGVVSERGLLASVNRFAATILEVVSLALIVVGIVTDISTDMLSVTAFAVLISVTVTERGLLGGTVLDLKIWHTLSPYTYSAYLFHAFVVYLLSFFSGHIAPIPEVIRIPLTLVGVAAAAFVAHVVITRAVRAVSKSKHSEEAVSS